MLSTAFSSLTVNPPVAATPGLRAAHAEGPCAPSSLNLTILMFILACLQLDYKDMEKSEVFVNTQALGEDGFQ